MNRIIIAAASLFMTLGMSCKPHAVADIQQKFVLTDTMMAHTALAKAEIKAVTGALKLYGKVTADNGRQAQVFPVVGGSVSAVNVELGDYVKQGQVLAVIRSSEIADFEKQRLDAVNDMAIAGKNLQVAQDMFAGKLTSEKDLLFAEKELEKAKASLQRINEVYRIYSIGKGATYNVVAPISGFIIDRNITQNMQLRSDKGESMFSIAQIDEVWVVANVNESDISRISQGMEANVRTLSYPDKVFSGKVDRIFNVLDDNTRSMKVRITIPNTDLLLKPEMSAVVSLRLREQKEMVAIPAAAVIFDKSKNWVMVYKGRDNIETRQVEVYSQYADTAYISAGLENAETVITANQMLIYDALND
jgi:membrane fusion protein, heavy metal efflux system